MAWQNPVFDRTIEDCVYGNPKGSWLFSVLNRIEGNIGFLWKTLRELNYAIPPIEIKTDWVREDYLRIGDLVRISNNLSVLRIHIPVTPTIPDLPWVYYFQVNDVEEMLLDLHNILIGMRRIYVRTGSWVAVTGSVYYFITEEPKNTHYDLRKFTHAQLKGLTHNTVRFSKEIGNA